MWKRKKKQKANEETEEIPSSKDEEEQVSVATEEMPSSKEEEKASEATQKTAPSKEEQITVTEETPSLEEVSPSGVFIFGKKIESRFKKFLTALFSIFLFPPLILFGLLIITSVVLLAFPLISIALPIVLLALCILLIALPVMLPLITVISLITGKGKVYFGLKNKKFAIKVLGITLPPYADR